MTTDEKLQHFLDICMEDAREKSARLYDEYASALEEAFEEHKKDAARRLDMQLHGESDKLGREMNKKLALGQSKLFVHFPKLLEQQILAARELAGSSDIIIYIDPADEPLLQHLSVENREAIKISQYSFSGGIRAVVPQSHILIDNSFETKLNEARHNFQFDLGGRDHE